MRPLSIGDVARQAGIGVETVRFYERRGLIEEPTRKASGYRQYSAEVVGRLRFIREAKNLGFTLNEIKELLSLKRDPTSSCAEIKKRAKVKIADIEEKVRALQRMKRGLVELTKACRGNGPTSECPILDALESEE